MNPNLSNIKTALDSGGVVMLPTETVYGIASKADNAKAIDRIYNIKGRKFDKPLAVCIKGLAQAEQLATFSKMAKSLALNFWPGPLTLVLPARYKALNARCYKENTIALRCPDSDWRMSLIDTPLALTSANRSGQPDVLSPDTSLPVDAILCEGAVTGGIASTILAVKGPKITLLREGALRAAQLGVYDIELP